MYRMFDDNSRFASITDIKTVKMNGVYYHTDMVASTEYTFALTCISVYQNATNHHLQPERDR
jgi:hypothetical protein